MFTDLFSISRHPGESLTYYSIRLTAQAIKVSNAAEGGRDAMVKSKFLSSLLFGLLGKINVQLGHLTDVSLEQMVPLASAL